MANLLIGTSGYDYPEWKETFYPAENRIYLAKLIEDFVGFPVVVEFRHREWIKPSVFEGLNERGTGIVFCDMLQRQRGKECNWENWIVFMLKGVELTAKETVVLINEIKNLMQDYKMKLRPLFGSKYNHELLNNLFRHPYTKIEYIMRDLEVTRLTATKYLDELVSANLVIKIKVGTSNYYINQQLVDLFINQANLYNLNV